MQIIIPYQSSLSDHTLVNDVIQLRLNSSFLNTPPQQINLNSCELDNDSKSPLFVQFIMSWFQYFCLNIFLSAHTFYKSVPKHLKSVYKFKYSFLFIFSMNRVLMILFWKILQVSYLWLKWCKMAIYFIPNQCKVFPYTNDVVTCCQ